MMSLITLIQNSKGSPVILKKILNSAAYKELSLEEQATILLNIAENSMENTEVLMSILKQLQLKLQSNEFDNTPIFFNALISLIKHSNGNKKVLNQLLDRWHGISIENFSVEKQQEFLVAVAENANGNVQILQDLLIQLGEMFFRSYMSEQIIPYAVIALITVINCAHGNVAILREIFRNYKERYLSYLSLEQQKTIVVAISSTLININNSMLEDVLNLASGLAASDLKEVLRMLAKNVNKDIKLLTKIIDCAHEYLPSQQQKEFLIDLVEITNMDPEILKLIADQAKYLSSQYSNEVLQFLDTKNTTTIDEHNEETAINISDSSNNTLLLSFTSTSASSRNMPEVAENKAIDGETQDEDLKAECKRPRYV